MTERSHPQDPTPRAATSLSVAAAAWLLQVRPAQVRAMVADGRLTARQPSRRWRIEPDDLRPHLRGLDARRALRDLQRGAIAVPPVPRDARPRPLGDAIKADAA